MNTTQSAPSETPKGSAADTFGWCDTRDNHDGRFDHRRQDSCRNFVPDREHTEELLRQARAHDAGIEIRYPSGATNPAAAYVAEHRPG